MNTESYFPLGGGWSLDQLFDFFPSDDTDMTKAQEGLPENSIKSETPADAPMGLEALCSSPTEGFLGLDWMEQDFDFNYSSILSLDDNLPCKPPSTILLPTTTASTSLNPVGEIKELESLRPEFADEFLHTEALLKQETPSSPSSYQNKTPEIHVTPEIVLDADTDETALQVLKDGNIEFLQCPLSSDDVESLLFSASSLDSSPAPTPLPTPSSPATTVDTSVLSTDTVLSSDSGSWSFSSSDLYKVVENTDQSRPTPYSRAPKSSKSSKSKGRKQTASISPTPSELELELMSKKDRKKLQNKNAAIRYRMKKKVETDDKRSEVEKLESINQSLHEKCEEVQREVKCMKDLINDIRKAKGQPPLPF